MAGQQGVRAGKAFVELYTKDSELVKGLRRAQRRLSAFGSQITRIGAITAGAGAGIVAAFVPAIKSASDLQEIMGKFTVVFGENSKAMKAWGDNFAAEVGRSKKQVAEFLSGSQDLFVPLGFEPGAAESLSKQLTTLAVDLASFNNMQDADAMRDLQAALTGSGEVMKKYGVIVSEAAVKQELLNQGFDPKTATDQMKVQARLNIIMRGTTAAQGDALRTSDSFANQMKRLKAVFEDTKDEVGNAFLPMLTEYLKKANELIPRIGQWIANNQGVIRETVVLIAKVGAAGVALVAFGKTITLLSVALGAVTSPVTLVVAALGAIAAVAYKMNQETGALNEGLAAFKSVMNDLGPILMDVGKWLVEWIAYGVEVAAEGLMFLIDTVNSLIDAYDELIGVQHDFLNGQDDALPGGIAGMVLEDQAKKDLGKFADSGKPKAGDKPVPVEVEEIKRPTGGGSNPIADFFRGADEKVKEGVLGDLGGRLVGLADATANALQGSRIQALSEGGTFSGNTSQFASMFVGNEPEEKVTRGEGLIVSELKNVKAAIEESGILG